MKQYQTKPVMLLLVLALAATAYASSDAVVAGVVRDTRGVPQMGALVQVLAPDATAVATAVTDLKGRYRIHGIVPGRYQMRATAVLYLPALRQNLRFSAGAQAIVNLTLSGLFETEQWLPAKRRSAVEPTDDWTWTLRSAENRPVLRVLDDSSVTGAKDSSEAQRRFADKLVAVIAGGGDFGYGGIHNVGVADRAEKNGAGSIVRADIGTGRMLDGTGGSFDLSAGYERPLGLAGRVRTGVSYQSHPELMDSSGSGLTAMTLVNAQTMQMGDTVVVEVGSIVRAIRSSSTAFAAQPFVKMTAQPAAGLLVTYRMATARDIESFGEMDSERPQTPFAVMQNGQMRMEGGRHQEISVAKKTGQGTVRAAVYQDTLTAPAISGVGMPGAATMAADAIVADAATGTFRMLGPSYSGRGVSLSVAEPISPSIWASAEYDTGDALTVQLHPVWSQAAMAAVEGRFLQSGTSLRVAYRWQPHVTVTAVNSYGPTADQPYLSFYLRQPLHCRRLLSNRLEAVVDVTNLLAEGYQPFLSVDGRTLLLAQSPRTVQGGLAFTF